MKMDIRCFCEKGFSIRGYVASKHGSTPDVSSIYPSGGELPPMEISSFRYWRCPSCAGIEEEAAGARAPEGNATYVDWRIPPTVQNSGTREQGLLVSDANEKMRAADVNYEDMEQGPTDIATLTLVPTIVTDVTEAPILQHQGEEMNTPKDARGKMDRPVVDLSREVEQFRGVQKKKRESLADILGIKPSSKAVSNDQKIPRSKTLANQQEEMSNEKASKRDKGKAIMTDAENAVVGLVPSSGEGLFIGSKEERMRNRTDVVPAPSKKKAKQTLALGLSENVTNLIRELPAPPAAAHFESEQQDQDCAGLSSGGLKPHSKQSKLDLDLSLGTFPKKNDAQYGGSTDRSSKKMSLDLNEAAAYTAAIPLLEKMDFLQLGPLENSLDQEKQKETDANTDDIPMDIFELLAKQQFEMTNSDAGHSPTTVHWSSDSARGLFNMVLLRGYSGLLPTVGAQHGASVPRKESPLSLPQPNSLFPPPPSALGFRFGGQPKQDGQRYRGKTISDIKDDELKKTEKAARFCFSGHIPLRTPDMEVSINLLQKAGSSSGIIRAGSDLYIPYLHDPRVRAPSPGQKHQGPGAYSNRPEAETASVPAVAPRSGTGRHVSAEGACKTNKNPSDFSIPEPGNKYTISRKNRSTKKREE